MSYGDLLGTPEIALGIPVPDCNLLTPDATHGVPVPPWEVESKIAGHIFALPLVPGHAYPVMGCGANYFGAGRSIVFDLQDDMDGSYYSFIRTGPTPFGWVPSYQDTHTHHRIGVLLIHNCTLSAGQSVVVELEAYSSSGSLLLTTDLATITSADNTDQKWMSYHNYPGETVIGSGVCYFRIKISIDANGSASTRVWGLDFIGLTWSPYGPWGPSPMEVFDDDYVGTNLTGQERMGVTVLDPPYGGSRFLLQNQRGAKYWDIGMQFIRASGTWRDKLNFLWTAQNGTTGAADKFVSGEASHLIGKPWPLILRPRRPNMKQALYCYMQHTPFPLDIDNITNYVEDDPTFTGQVRFTEVDF